MTYPSASEFNLYEPNQPEPAPGSRATWEELADDNWGYKAPHGTWRNGASHVQAPAGP